VIGMFRFICYYGMRYIEILAICNIALIQAKKNNQQGLEMFLLTRGF
jgi:hypothetical protein